MNPQPPAVALVERDTDTCELYRRQLARDYTVFPCVDAAELHQVARQQRLRLIVLEPAGLSGLAFDSLDEVPLLVCSTSETCDPAIRRRAVAYLVKPVLPSVLQQAIQQVLDVIGEQAERPMLALRVQT